jgi:hypothetical protein
VHPRPHLPRPVVDERERFLARRRREDEVAFGSSDDAVHARETRNLRRGTLGIEVEDNQGAIPEVRDVQAPIERVDGLIIETRRPPGKRHVRDMVERERAFRRGRSRGEQHDHEPECANHRVIKSRMGPLARQAGAP